MSHRLRLRVTRLTDRLGVVLDLAEQNALQAEIARYEAYAVQLLSGDAIDPCWRCQGQALNGEPYCQRTQLPVPATGCCLQP
jgi:hypothetical protein